MRSQTLTARIKFYPHGIPSRPEDASRRWFAATGNPRLPSIPQPKTGAYKKLRWPCQPMAAVAR